MKLTDSSAAKTGSSPSSAIITVTPAFYHVHNYSDITLSKAISGSVGLYKNGSGILNFSANNTYTGATTVNQGTLKLSGGAGVGSSVTVNSGATLDLNAQGVSPNLFLGTGSITNTNASLLTLSIAPTIAQSYTNSFNGNLGFLVTQGAVFTLLNSVNNFTGGVYVANYSFRFYGIGDGGVIQLGNITVASDMQYLGSANITTNRVISVNFTVLTNTRVYVYNNGSGTINFTGGMYTENPNTVSQIIELSGTNTGDNYISGVVKNSGPGASASNVLSLDKTGVGKWILSGNNTYTGTTTLTLGTFGFAHSSAFGVGGNIIFKGGTLQYNGVSTDLSARIKSSTSAIIIDTNGQSVTFASALANTNTSGLTKTGLGTLTLNASALYTGATSVAGGTLVTGTANIIPDTSAVTVASGAVLLLGGNETVGSIAGAGTYNINGYVFTVGGDNSTTSFSGNITGTNGQLVKNGTGVLTLSGSNTYTGNTTINAGTIVFQTKSAASTSTITTTGTGGIGLGVGAGPNDWTVSDIVTLFNAGTVGSLTVSATANIAVDTSSGNVTISDALSSSRTLLKVGANTLTLSGGSSYTGSTVILNGTIATSGANKLPDTSAINISSGATLSLGGNDTVGSVAGAGSIALGANTLTTGADNTSTTLSGVISGTGSVFKTGTGVLTLSGANTFSGGLTVDNGTVKMGNSSARGSGATVLSNTGILDLNGYTISPVSSTFTTGSNTKIINSSTGGFLDFTSGQSPTVNAAIDDSAGQPISMQIGGNGAFPTFTNTNNKIRGSITWIPNGGCSVANLNAGAFGTGDIPVANSNTQPAIIHTGSSNSVDTSRNIKIQGIATAGVQLVSNGAGTLTFGGAYSSTAGLKRLTLRGTNTGDNTMAGTIYDGSAGSLEVYKSEAGKWILSGTLTYTGTTSITAGTLRRTFSSGALSYAEFTSTTCFVYFSSMPTAGNSFRIFPGTTTQTYSSVTVLNAPGAACSYNSSTSTVTVTAVAGSTATYTAIQAGALNTIGDVDDVGGAARLYYPYGLSFDSSGVLWFTDSLNFKVKKMTADKTVTTVAGSSQGAVDGTGANAKFRSTDHLVVDTSGNIFVCDRLNSAIRKVTPAGVVTTFAGLMGSSGSADGTGTSARFNTPHGICIDSSNNLWVADIGNNTIRKITPAGVVTTFAGTAGTSGSTDGTGSSIRFDAPYAVTVDSSGNLYVADASSVFGGGGATTGGTTIRKITPLGVSSTICGSPNVTGYTDATGSLARFNGMSGLCVDLSGNVYAADRYNNAIRKITPSGVVSTFIGPNVGSYELNNPCGVAFDSTGALFITDAFGEVIRKKIV